MLQQQAKIYVLRLMYGYICCLQSILIKIKQFWSPGRIFKSCPVSRSSLSTTQARSLDRAQRIAMATIIGWWEPLHTKQLLDLGLDWLGPRRDILCKRFSERTAKNSRISPIQSNTKLGAQYTQTGAPTNPPEKVELRKMSLHFHRSSSRDVRLLLLYLVPFSCSRF